MADLPKRVALVYDRVNKWGGAERVLLALHELFPQAPLFTAVYNSGTAQWAGVFPDVVPTFLQQFPLASTHHELYPWATPLAFESLKFPDYEMVISVTSADAKGIITMPGTFHLCYCLTPTRYLWSHEQDYKQQLDPATRAVTQPLFNYLKSWDKLASTRPDAYIAISQTVKNRIKNFYDRESSVVYPPVDVNLFQSPRPAPGINDFFLYVGRLVAYKRAQLLVETFNDLQLPLAIIGSGSLESRLRDIAHSNIHFLGNLIDDELAAYYQHARALIFFHEEDFGIVPVEAMAAGTPVIGLNRGGVSETVLHHQTGELIEDSIPALRGAIAAFDKSSFDATVIQARAQLFSKDRFLTEFNQSVSTLWSKYKNTYMS